ncbi:MAG: molybdenum cofactor biosynthesis protein MoaE [Albidovulum sp.]|nr:molybdenum cofactor biosynthesis protein MoaE [Albidovulum sp.]MDE0531643.1 molybdenum cofactor biosynthesis protein MoaE [Albidovulum sp.]
MSVRIQSHRFDIGAELEAFSSGRTDAGAMVNFCGIVRQDSESPLARMVIEHYPGMTEKSIRKIEDEAKDRWSLIDSLIVHRFGELGPGEPIMMVATLAKHRAEAFSAAEFLMDYLKSRAPFWKKEIRSGEASWVASKLSDEAALDRWN